MTAAAQPMLQTELWLSFLSLLRSYAAAASLHSGAVHVATTENSATLTAGNAQLAMTFDPDSSQVSWTQHTPSQAPITGSFELLPEGAIAINGATKDLDHAAIDFIDLASQQRNVKGHDFSRAVKASQKNGALAPDGNTGEKP